MDYLIPLGESGGSERLLLPVLRQPMTLLSLLIPTEALSKAGIARWLFRLLLPSPFLSSTTDMRKHSLLSVVCYGLATILPGAWSAPHNTTRDGFAKSPRSFVTKRAITVDPSTCIGTWRTSVDSAVREALAMVRPRPSLLFLFHPFMCITHSRAGDWSEDARVLTITGTQVNYVIPHFQTLLNNLNSNPVPTIIGMNNAQRTVFQTYESFFGQTYFGTDTQANRAKNAAAIVRLNKLISRCLGLICPALKGS